MSKPKVASVWLVGSLLPSHTIEANRKEPTREPTIGGLNVGLDHRPKVPLLITLASVPSGAKSPKSRT